MADVMAEALAIAGGGGGPIHVDLDVDVCDRSVVPGCPAAAPGGLTADELRQVAFHAGRSPRVRSIDITEIDATADAPDGRTVRLGALLVLEAACGLRCADRTAAGRVPPMSPAPALAAVASSSRTRPGRRPVASDGHPLRRLVDSRSTVLRGIVLPSGSAHLLAADHWIGWWDAALFPARSGRLGARRAGAVRPRRLINVSLIGWRAPGARLLPVLLVGTLLVGFAEELVRAAC